MNKETVKGDLKLVFLKEGEARKMRKLCHDAQNAEKKAIENLNGARGLLRKSIEDNKEVYITIEGKFYRITPNSEEQFNIFIGEIEVIK